MDATCLRQAPSFALYFVLYYELKAKLIGFSNYFHGKDENRHQHKSDKYQGDHLYESMLAGGLAGSVCWALVYPFDVIKSRTQTLPLDAKLLRSPEINPWRVLSHILSREGFSGLYRACGITIFRAFPVNAVIFPVYEVCLKLQTQGFDFDRHINSP